MPEQLPRVVIVGGGFGGLAATSECKEGIDVVMKADLDSLARRTEI